MGLFGPIKLYLLNSKWEAIVIKKVPQNILLNTRANIPVLFCSQQPVFVKLLYK